MGSCAPHPAAQVQSSEEYEEAGLSSLVEQFCLGSLGKDAAWNC